jgi:hypothetical protein
MAGFSLFFRENGDTADLAVLYENKPVLILSQIQNSDKLK